MVGGLENQGGLLGEGLDKLGGKDDTSVSLQSGAALNEISGRVRASAETPTGRSLALCTRS